MIFKKINGAHPVASNLLAEQYLQAGDIGSGGALECLPQSYHQPQSYSSYPSQQNGQGAAVAAAAYLLADSDHYLYPADSTTTNQQLNQHSPTTAYQLDTTPSGYTSATNGTYYQWPPTAANSYQYQSTAPFTYAALAHSKYPGFAYSNAYHQQAMAAAAYQNQQPSSLEQHEQSSSPSAPSGPVYRWMQIKRSAPKVGKFNKNHRFNCVCLNPISGIVSSL